MWFVVGDVDPDRTVDLLRETKVRPLIDEVVRVRVRDRARHSDTGVVRGRGPPRSQPAPQLTTALGGGHQLAQGVRQPLEGGLASV